MSQEVKQDFSFDFFSIINLTLRWKMPILIVTIAAGLATYLFTGPAFMKPLYKASVIFYPTTNANVSNSLMNEPGTLRYGLLEFGSDQDAEQILQILKSDEVKNMVIKQFDLARHYGLDTSNGISMYSLQMMLNKNLNVKQTEYKAIEITVYDTDPQVAADMANFVAYLADYQKTAVQKNKAKEALDILYTEYIAQQHFMDSMNGILMKLREKGVYDYFEQSSQLNEALATNMIRYEQEAAMLKIYEENQSALPDTLIVKTKARVQGYKAAINSIKPKLEMLKTYGGTYLDNINNLELERKKLASLKMRYESAKLDSEKGLSQRFTINPAVKPEIPAKPRRLLSAGVAVIATFFFSILVIMLIDAYPSFKRRLN